MKKITPDYVNNYLLLTRNIRHLGKSSWGEPAFLSMQIPRRAIRCADGFRISVQASEHNYCTPRTLDGPWDTVECMVKNGRLKYHKEWREYESDGVYGYVPAELVNREIAAHGGVETKGEGK